MDKLNKNNIGLSLGITFLVLHVVWFTVVFLGLGQQLISSMTEWHFVKFNIEIIEFSVFSAIGTLIRAFIVGYIVGWFFSSIYNRLQNEGKK